MAAFSPSCRQRHADQQRDRGRGQLPAQLRAARHRRGPLRARPRAVMTNAVLAARADLVAENIRLIAEKQADEEQRDEALKLARDQVVPLLTTFNASVASRLPILQDVVRQQEEGGPRPDHTLLIAAPDQLHMYLTG